MNQNYFEPNPCYEHNSSSFDQFQPPRYSDVHRPSKEISIDELKIMMQSYIEQMNQLREQEDLLAEQELREQEQAAQEKEEPPQNSDIRQLIREVCGIKFCEEQKQNMEDTMLELIEVCRQKELYCKHNDVDDLIESALNSKLLSINLKSQRLDKEKKEVKNIIEQPTKRRNRITKSLQNFRVIHKKSSISLNNTSQISLINAITSVLPTEESEYSLSMGDEHLSTTPETESDEIIKSSVENLVPIPSEYEASLLDSELVSLEEENDVYQEEKEIDLEDILQIQDVILREKLLSINRLITDIKFLNDNPTPNRVLESSFSFHIFEKSDNSLSYLDNSLPEFETFSDHIEETRSGSTTAHANNSPPNNDSLPLPENESSNFDHHDDLSFTRPPPEPPDVEIFFEPDSGVLTTNVVKGIYEHYVLMPNILPTLPTFDPLYPVYDTLLLFSSENEDKVFKPGILSYLLVSHRDKTTFDFSKNSMMMYGGDIPSKVVSDLHTIPMDK
nr:hypothetical protein [Tanacetum cinerariifolium]